MTYDKKAYESNVKEMTAVVLMLLSLLSVMAVMIGFLAFVGCKCTPNIRTPWCGKIGCEQPKQIKNTEDDTCRCGHERALHGQSHSINYTDGKCSNEKCSCENFCMPYMCQCIRSGHDKCKSTIENILEPMVNECKSGCGCTSNFKGHDGECVFETDKETNNCRNCIGQESCTCDKIALRRRRRLARPCK